MPDGSGSVASTWVVVCEAGTSPTLSKCTVSSLLALGISNTAYDASSTGTGHLMNAGDSYVIRGYGNIQRFRAINAVASSGAQIFCTFFY